MINNYNYIIYLLNVTIDSQGGTQLPPHVTSSVRASRNGHSVLLLRSPLLLHLLIEYTLSLLSILLYLQHSHLMNTLCTEKIVCFITKR